MTTDGPTRPDPSTPDPRPRPRARRAKTSSAQATAPTTDAPTPDALLTAALGNLDARLLAVCDAEEKRAALLSGDGRPGWDGVRNLARPATLALRSPAPDAPLLPPGHPVFDRLRRHAGLDDLALDVLLVLLAPHLEPRYSSLYAVLQDDLDERRPTERLLHLVLGGTPPTPGAPRAPRTPPSPDTPTPPPTTDTLTNDALRRALDPAGPLVRSGLVRRASGSQPPLRRPFEIADDVVHVLLADPHPGVPGALRTSWTTGTALPGAATRERVGVQVLHGTGDAVALARSVLPREAGIAVVEVAPPGASPTSPNADAAATCQAAWRIALCTGATPLLDLRSWPEQDVAAAVTELAALVRAVGGRTWVAARQPVTLPVAHLEAAAAHWEDRRRAWAEHARSRGADLAPGAAEALASRHRLDPPAIADLLDHVPAFDEATLDAEARAVAAVAVPASRLASARRTLDDLVLTPTTRDALDRLVHYVDRRDRLAQEQGLASRHRVERGPLVLFAGRPGTGKTAAAEGVARALGRPLFTLDLSQLMSKYIGETEKHVDEVLRAAQLSSGVLFCDEADALFSSRIEKATNAGEHFANVLVGYLLQRIEVHEGTVILATNLRHAMDEAFLRRFQFRVEFPLPSPAERVRIWELMLPDGVPRGEGLDLAAVGMRSDLSGGDIANAALRAIFLADRDGGPVTQDRLERAVALELMEQGRLSRRPDDVAAGLPPDRGLLLRAFVDVVEARVREALRAHFLKEVHVVHGSPSEDRLSGRRPAVSISLLRLAARRGNNGMRAGFVASAWSIYPEEEYELIGVVHEALLGLGITEIAGRPATVRLQESSDFDLLHKFWSSHERPVRASVVLDVEIE